MPIYTKKQQKIAKDINSIVKNNDDEISISNWKNWKWQINHTIRDINTFEKLLDIKFNSKKRRIYLSDWNKGFCANNFISLYWADFVCF